MVQLTPEQAEKWIMDSYNLYDDTPALPWWLQGFKKSLVWNGFWKDTKQLVRWVCTSIAVIVPRNNLIYIFFHRLFGDDCRGPG